MKKFFQQILKDETGIYSSKRFAGLLCVVVLNLALIVNIISKRELTPSPELITALEVIALGSLGLTVFDKGTLRRNHIKEGEEK